MVTDDSAAIATLRDKLAAVASLQVQWTLAGKLAEALHRLGEERFDAVLLDLNLPDSRGPETCSKLHAHAPDAPIVVLTGQEDESLALDAVRTGAQDYLVLRKVDGRVIARVLQYAVERKRLEQLKDQFISAVSHELRTPLTVMREGVALLSEGTMGSVNERQQKVLGIARENLVRLGRIVDGLFEFSALGSGKVKLQKDRTDITALAESVVGAFREKAVSKGLSIRMKNSSKSKFLDVYADPEKIAQALHQLVGNAVKFTAKGTVEVSVAEKDSCVECIVSDTGVGISEEDMPKVFTRFAQFRRMPGGLDNGIGLGLAITKGIVELHDGTVRIESGPGKGTTVAFSLPKYTAETLFKEHVRECVKKAMQKGSNLSLILVTPVAPRRKEVKIPESKLDALVAWLEALLHNNLRRQGDVVVQAPDGGLGVLLVDCDRSGAVVVKARLEQALEEYLAEGEMDGKIKFRLGCATCPSQAKSDVQLIEAARKS